MIASTEPDVFTRSCARCDWSIESATRWEAREEAGWHADAAEHPLCQICGRSLPALMDYTCQGCISRTRNRITAIVTMYALLPVELEEGRPDVALVILGPGNAGAGSTTEQSVQVPPGLPEYPYGAPGRRRRPRAYTGVEHYVPFGPLLEWQSRHPLAAGGGWEPVDVEEPWKGTSNGLGGDDDPEPIAATLGSWEDDWRTINGDVPAMEVATVAGATNYLLPRLAWAAQEHPAFLDFIDDLRRMQRQLEDATAAGERPQRSDVPCFDCDAHELRRGYRPGDPCDHEEPERIVLGYQVWARRDPKDPDSPYAFVRPATDYDESAGSYHQRLIAWRVGVFDELGNQVSPPHICNQGGRVDVWTCRSCGRVYEPAEYWNAVRGLLQDRAAKKATR